VAEGLEEDVEEDEGEEELWGRLEQDIQIKRVITIKTREWKVL